MAIELPAGGWRPRPHQRRLWSYLEHGGKRAIVAAHRRWGKDDVALHFTATAAHKKVADWWHALPQYNQARKAIWQAVNPHTGQRRIDEAFPHKLRASTNETEMSILFKNGSRWRVVGTDNPNSLVGTAPAGIVFSEWALSNPSSWAYLAPILDENGGWAAFITTPRGRNHAYSMYEMARKSKDWLALKSTVIDSGYPLDRVEAQRAEYHQIFGEDAGDALIEQEFYCSFDAAILGSYWGRELTNALMQGRITDVSAEPGAPIHRAWDLGIGDSTAIWFFQMFAGEIRVLDYYESHGVGIDHYAKLIREDYNIRGGIDFVPHDAKFRESGNKGKMRVTAMIEDGLNPEVVTLHKVEDGINAARRILHRCWFDEERCAKGLEMLRHYRAEWDDKKRTFNDRPEHDFSSHASDAFRYLAMAYEDAAAIAPLPKTKILQITAPGANPLKGIMPVTGHEIDGVSLQELFELNERGNNRADGYR